MYKKISTVLMFSSFALLSACSSGPDEGKIIGFQVDENTFSGVYFTDSDSYIDISKEINATSSLVKRFHKYMSQGEFGPISELEGYLSDDQIEEFQESLTNPKKGWKKYKAAHILEAKQKIASIKKELESLTVSAAEYSKKRTPLDEAQATLKKEYQENTELRQKYVTKINDLMVIDGFFMGRNYRLYSGGIRNVVVNNLKKEECNIEQHLNSNEERSEFDEEHRGFPVFVDNVCYQVYDYSENDSHTPKMSRYIWRIKHEEEYRDDFEKKYKQPLVDSAISVYSDYVKNIYLAKIKPTDEKRQKNNAALNALGYDYPKRHLISKTSKLKHALRELSQMEKQTMPSGFERRNQRFVEEQALEAINVNFYKELHDDYEGDIQYSKINDDGKFDIPSSDFAVITTNPDSEWKTYNVDLREFKDTEMEVLEINYDRIYGTPSKLIADLVKSEYFQGQDEFTPFPVMIESLISSRFRVNEE